MGYTFSKKILTVVTAILAVILSIALPNNAESSFYLSFPLSDYGPYDAPISTVFDHSMSTPYSKNRVVIAFTGETGNQTTAGGCDCYNKSDVLPFAINGNYTGDHNCGRANYLCYDGHPGFDYAVANKHVYAAADGIVHFPTSFPGVSNAQAYNTIEIDHQNGYKTYYLHLNNRDPVSDGQYVTRGQLIGTSGNFDTQVTVGYHLHFEVQLNGVPVDPYGWKGPGTDPYTRASSIDLWQPANTGSVPSSASIDLALLIDTTSSMTDDIAAAKAAAVDIVNSIDSQTKDYRIAVVSFEDFPYEPYGYASCGDYMYHDVLNFSNNKANIVSAIQGLPLRCGDDPQESLYSALMHVLQKGAIGGWRDGVRKKVIYMTDASPHDPEPFTGYTLNDVKNAAKALDPAVIYPIVVGGDPTTTAYSASLAQGTGGKMFEAGDSGEVVQSIMSAIETALQPCSIPYPSHFYLYFDLAAAPLNSKFMWSSVWEAISYDAQICSTSDCSSTVLTTSSNKIRAWQVVSGLNPNTTYWFRVRSVNSCGNGSWGWLTHSFTTSSCGYSLAPQAYAYGPEGGMRTVTVTPTSSSCAWTATSNDPWITVTSGSSGTGNGTVSYYVDANTAGNVRTGSITIGGQGFKVYQVGSTFIDDPRNALTPYINAMSAAGITHGCNGSSAYYCLSDPVTRSAMAVFIIRALYGDSFPYTQTPYFTDVPPTYGAFSYIQKFRDANITQHTGTYDINGIVTRGQMAVFIVRALYGDSFPYTQTQYFTDVPPEYGAFSYIQKMKDVGITQHIGTYDVDAPVTRDQMAVFLGRAFLGMP